MQFTKLSYEKHRERQVQKSLTRSASKTVQIFGVDIGSVCSSTLPVRTLAINFNAGFPTQPGTENPMIAEAFLPKNRFPNSYIK